MTLVLAGDFRQILPVIPRGNSADQINICLRKSYFWDHIQKVSLTINMQVHLDIGDAEGEFATQLLNVGNGFLDQDFHNQIQLPFQTNQTEDELINKVFPDVHIQYNNKWLYDRALLTPTNISVKEMNVRLLNMLPGEEKVYKSIENIVSKDQIINYPTELLNSLEPTGTTPHNLILKFGAPIMLLRNLNPPKLCNGTRLIINRMMSHVLEATIISGKYEGVNCFIPRTPMRPTDLPY